MEVEIRSEYLKEFITEIIYKNRNPRNLKALELLEDISTNPECVIHSNSNLYRSRIIKRGEKTNECSPFFGFNAKDSFVSPIDKTRDLRANYKYIPYLYCSNNPYIASVEVRPMLGSSVSVATILVKEDLKLLDFTGANRPPNMSNEKIKFFSDLSNLYSKPVTYDDDTKDYIPTQFIAEYVKNLNYDGIIFKSSLVPEINKANLCRYNAVVFNYNKCEAIKSNVWTVAENYFDFEQRDNDSNPVNVESYITELLSSCFNNVSS